MQTQRILALGQKGAKKFLEIRIILVKPQLMAL